MRICSILLIESTSKWYTHLSRSILLYFNYLVRCHCWWTRESPSSHLTKFFGRLRLIPSVLRASKLSVFKINWNCKFVGLFHYPFRLQLDLALLTHHFSTFNNYIVWLSLRITDEGSVHEKGMWSILFIKSDLKFCIHISRSIFLYVNVYFYEKCPTTLTERKHRGHILWWRVWGAWFSK